MPDFIYDRVVNIYRSNTTSTPEDGLHQREELMHAGLDANIQVITDRAYTVKVSPGPTDVTESITLWNIHIPDASLGDINKGDKIVDDLGRNYKVEVNAWTHFGYQIQARDFHP